MDTYSGLEASFSKPWIGTCPLNDPPQGISSGIIVAQKAVIVVYCLDKPQMAWSSRGVIVVP